MKYHITYFLWIFMLGIIFSVKSVTFNVQSNDGSIVYRSSYNYEPSTKTTKFKLITRLQTKFLNLSLGNRIVKQILLNESHNYVKRPDNYSVRLVVQPFNRYLTSAIVSLKLRAICEFIFPMSIRSDSAFYSCNVFIKNVAGTNKKTVGSCQLTIGFGRSTCLISGEIKNWYLDGQPVKVGTQVNYCLKQECSSFKERSGWSILIKRYDMWWLTGSGDILWNREFKSHELGYRIFYGLPRISIDMDRQLEIPIIYDTKKNLLRMIYFQIFTDETIELSEIIACDGYRFESSDFGETEEGKFYKTDVQLFIDQYNKKNNRNYQNSKCFDKTISMVLKFGIDPDSSDSKTNILLKLVSITAFDDSNTQVNTIVANITLPFDPMFKDIYTNITKPDLLSKLSTNLNALPYQLTQNNLAFFTYKQTIMQNLQLFQCRPINPNFLKCPSTSDKVVDKYSLAKSIDPIKYKWFVHVEIMSFYYILIDMSPVISLNNNWSLNSGGVNWIHQIKNWDAPSLQDIKKIMNVGRCVPFYQPLPIKVLKRIQFKTISYDGKLSKRSFDLDFSEKITESQIKMRNSNAAIIYKSRYSKQLYLQPSLLTTNKISLFIPSHQTNSSNNEIIYSNFTVNKKSTSAINIVDLQIKCLSGSMSIKKIQNYQMTNELYKYHDIELQFQYTPTNHKTNDDSYYLEIDILMSNNFRINIFELLKEQYELEIVYDGKTRSIRQPNDLWVKLVSGYVFVKLKESNYCGTSKTLYEKQFRLFENDKITTKLENTVTSLLDNKSVQTSTPSLSNIPNNNVSSTIDQLRLQKNHHKMVLIIAIVSIILLVIITINLVVPCLIKFRPLLFKQCYSSNKNDTRNGNHTTNGHGTLKELNNNNNETSFPLLSQNPIEYPPLLPPPGPQLDSKTGHTQFFTSPFVRQASLPPPTLNSLSQYNLPRHKHRLSQEFAKIPSSTNVEGTVPSAPCYPLLPTSSSPSTPMDDFSSSGFGTMRTSLGPHQPPLVLESPLDNDEENRYNKLMAQLSSCVGNLSSVEIASNSTKNSHRSTDSFGNQYNMNKVEYGPI